MNNNVVFINLDRERELRFGHKALKKLVALTGKDLVEIEESFTDFEIVEKVVYCGLLNDAKERGEDLKLEDMEELLDQAPNYAHIMEQMRLAFNAAFGVTPEQDPVGNQSKPGEAPATKERDSTGKKATE